MEQHPIPQNISSYQFRLVGDMTLKQFFQLAGGIIVGLIFYSSPLLPIIKWPFAIISGILGVALAFLPLEERPLEKWIISFFKAIYSPTLYVWRRGTSNLKLFQDEPLQTVNTTIPDEEINKSLGTKKIETPLSKLEDAEKGFLTGVTSLLSNLIPAKPAVEPIIPVAAPTPIPHPQPQPQQFQVPVSAPVKIPQQERPQVIIEEKLPTQTSQVSPLLAGNEMISTKQAMFSVDAAPPNPPVVPNVVVGQVVDENRKIIEGAIMEIRDSQGRPIRALKSNQLGHFVIVTPLDNGKYELVADKEGFEFTPVFFDAEGELVPPILVQGKRIEIT